MTLTLPNVLETDVSGPLKYREWQGPPETTFVLVHGLGGSSISWAYVAPGLSQIGRVLAPDLVGFGETPRAGRDTGLMSERFALSRFICEHATGRVVLCGSSMGGAISILQAAVEPAEVGALILSCSVYPPVAGALPDPLVAGIFAGYATRWIGEWIVGARFRRADVERLVRTGFAMNEGRPHSVPEPVILSTIELETRRQSDPEAPSAFLLAARSLLRLGGRRAAARRALDGVGCPVLVLHGRLDRFIPIEWAAAELRRHPSWRHRFFHDLGHVPQLEAPGPWLAAVFDWWSDVVH